MSRKLVVESWCGYILIGIARLKSCADRNASIVWSRMERTTRRVGSDSSLARDTRCRSSKRPQSLLNQYLVYIVAWNRTLATDTRHRYHAANKVTKTATRPSRINSSIRHWEKFRSILIHVFSRLLIFN